MRTWNFIFPILVVILLISIFLYVESSMQLPSGNDPLKGALNDVDKKALEIFQNLSELFTSLSIAIIGGIGFFLKNSFEGKYQISRKELLSGELVIICAVFSIFFGHLSLNAVLIMLAVDVFSIRDESLIFYGRMQYLFFLLSLLLFFVFIHYSSWSKAIDMKEANRN